MAEHQPSKNNRKQKGRRRLGKRLSPVTKRILALILTVLVFCGAVAMVAYRDQFNLDALKRHMTYRSLEKNDQGQTAEFTYTRDATNAFASLNGSLVLCSDTALQLYSNSGVLYIDRQVKMNDPVISVCGSYAVVYDVGGNNLYVIHNKEVVFEYTSKSGCDLLSARVNENGCLAVVEEASGYKASVRIYNSAFQLVLAENVSSEYVVDAVISPSNSQFAVVSIAQRSGKFSSIVSLYDGKEGDQLASTVLEDQFILELHWESNNIWLQGNDSATVLDQELNVLGTWSEPNQYLQGYSLNGDNYAVEVASWYKAGGSGEVLLIDERGDTACSKAISGEVLSVSAAGRYIAVLTAEALTIYTSNDLEEYAQIENNGSKRAIIHSDGATMMIGADSTWLYVP